VVGAARAVDEVLDAAVVFAVVVAVAGLVVADVDVVGLETTEVVATRAVVDVAATVDVVARSVVVGARRVVDVVGLVGTVALLSVMRSGHPLIGAGIKLNGPRYSAASASGTVRER